MAYIEIPDGEIVRRFELDLSRGPNPPEPPEYSPELCIALGLTGSENSRRGYKLEVIADAINNIKKAEGKNWNELDQETRQRYLKKSFYNSIVKDSNKI